MYKPLRVRGCVRTPVPTPLKKLRERHTPPAKKHSLNASLCPAIQHPAWLWCCES